MSPYRTMCAPPVTDDRSWRRWLVDSCGALRDSQWWRRWAGGRWARYRHIYNGTGEVLSFLDRFTMLDFAVVSVHGHYPDRVSLDYALGLMEDRWRRVASCPHEAMAYMVAGADGIGAIERRRVPCDCEVWPRTA